MAMPAPPPLAPDTSRRDWTVEELALIPDDGNRYEIVDGELLVTPAPSWTHQGAVGDLFELLQPYSRVLGLLCVFAPADVPLSRTTVVEPDLFVVPLRHDGSRPREFSEARHLELAVEVLSPSTARADRHVKRAAYLKHGVPDYWIVDTANRFVERWRPGDDAPEVLVDTFPWQPVTDVPPLVIDLPAYFRRVHGE
jgi:Uma2 family endonuclease